jgi:TonB family protein
MNPPAGKPLARRPAEKRPVQLNLRRTPTWPEEDELNERPDNSFWKWFALVFLLHIVAFVVLILIFNHRPKPPPDFISLLPPGEVVKGTPGQAAAKKIAPTTMAPSHTEVATPTPTPPKPITPPKPKVQQVQPPTPKPPPIIARDSPTPIQPVKPKPQPPKPPKVKIDLSQLVNAPSDDQPAPKTKAKTPPKKPVKKHHDTPVASIDNDTPGLSRDEVAQKLGEKLSASGVDKAERTGVNGGEHTKSSDFSGFYQSIHDQVTEKWTVPNSVDQTAVDPIVQIHVDKDGRVPAGLVKLLRSSNNPAFDQSALEAARNMGSTLQPLPDGCPPDISITFNLRQQ